MLIILFTVGGGALLYVVDLMGVVPRTLPTIMAVIVAAIVGTFANMYPELAGKFARSLWRILWKTCIRLSDSFFGTTGKVGDALRSLRPRSGFSFARSLAVYLVVLLLGGGTGWVANTQLTRSPRPPDTLPCSQPLELRVLTSPETRDAIQTAADRFAANQGRNMNCRQVHITVFAQASFTDVQYAFENRWEDDPSRQTPGAPTRLLIGPHPDVWLPGSSAVVEYVSHNHTRAST